MFHHDRISHKKFFTEYDSTCISFVLVFRKIARSTEHIQHYLQRIKSTLRFPRVEECPSFQNYRIFLCARSFHLSSTPNLKSVEWDGWRAQSGVWGRIYGSIFDYYAFRIPTCRESTRKRFNSPSSSSRPHWRFLIFNAYHVISRNVVVQNE